MSPFGSTCWHSVTVPGLTAAESAGSQGKSVEMSGRGSALFGTVTSDPSRRRAPVFCTRGWSDVRPGSLFAAGKICEHALPVRTSVSTMRWRGVKAVG
jgi:hypothetical protein